MFKLGPLPYSTCYLMKQQDHCAAQWWPCPSAVMFFPFLQHFLHVYFHGPHTVGVTQAEISHNWRLIIIIHLQGIAGMYWHDWFPVCLAVSASSTNHHFNICCGNKIWHYVAHSVKRALCTYLHLLLTFLSPPECYSPLIPSPRQTCQKCVSGKILNFQTTVPRHCGWVKLFCYGYWLAQNTKQVLFGQSYFVTERQWVISWDKTWQL